MSANSHPGLGRAKARHPDISLRSPTWEAGTLAPEPSPATSRSALAGRWSGSRGAVSQPLSYSREMFQSAASPDGLQNPPAFISALLFEAELAFTFLDIQKESRRLGPPTFEWGGLNMTSQWLHAQGLRGQGPTACGESSRRPCNLKGSLRIACVILDTDLMFLAQSVKLGSLSYSPVQSCHLYNEVALPAVGNSLGCLVPQQVLHSWEKRSQ